MYQDVEHLLDSKCLSHLFNSNSLLKSHNNLKQRIIILIDIAIYNYTEILFLTECSV